MSKRLPLLTHGDADAPIAWRDGRPIPVRQFLRDSAALARRLPAAPAQVNLCTDRYRFLVGFAAALLRGQVCLLPPSAGAGALGEVAAHHPEAYCLSDDPAGAGPGLPCLAWEGAGAQEPAVADLPHIDADAPAAVAFTSGSTGCPQPHLKRWGTLAAGARLTGARLGMGPGSALLATVPQQHMYGLETSILLPLQHGGALVAERPFFPADVARALARLPAGRGLITTPFHLRALVGESAPLPATGFILSATAPLSQTLAAEAEARLAAPLYEIYGSTETGAVATRRTAREAIWQPLSGITLTPAGDLTWARGGHLPEPTALQDRIAPAGTGGFTLLGRGAELINIAGKRISLGELTARLQALPGVEEVALVLPEEAADRVERLAALVVAPGRNAAELLTALRAAVDPVFLPRPLKLVEALPRNATGKLPRGELLRLLAE